MAIGNYLIMVGSYKIPLEYMRQETYQITYSTLDLDSYRDANGVLHRNALSHKVSKIEFNVPMMSMSKLQTLIKNITDNYVNATEKKVLVTYYNIETDSYLSQNMYVPDIPFTIRNADLANGIVNMNETRIAFIGY